MMGESCVCLGSKEIWFLCFRGIHNSLPSFWAKFGYSRIKIDHIADSLLKLQTKIGVHLISVELLQLLTLYVIHLVYVHMWSFELWDKDWFLIFSTRKLKSHFQRKLWYIFLIYCCIILLAPFCQLLKERLSFFSYLLGTQKVCR